MLNVTVETNLLPSNIGAIMTQTAHKDVHLDYLPPYNYQETSSISDISTNIAQKWDISGSSSVDYPENSSDYPKKCDLSPYG